MFERFEIVLKGGIIKRENKWLSLKLRTRILVPNHGPARQTREGLASKLVINQQFLNYLYLSLYEDF